MLSDMVEREFECCGYQCSVRMNPHLFFRLGYVTVPKGHPAYGKGMFDVNVDVPGDVTYSSRSDDGDGWTIGFDCGHAFDAPDREVARRHLEGEALAVFERYADVCSGSLFSPSHVWTTEEVEQEVIEMARQLKEMEEGK